MGFCSATGSWIANHKICSGLAAATLLVIITVLGWPIARAKTSAVIKTPDHSRAEGLGWENERLRQAAIERAESAARDEKDQTAARATDQIRKTGDTALLLEFLLHQRQKIQAKAGKDCIEINREICVIAFLCGEIPTAQEAVNQILQVSPDDLWALNRKGHIHRLRGDLDKAQQSYQRVLDLATARNDRTWQANAYGNLGILYDIRGELDEAQRMLRKALAMNQALGRKEGMAIAYINLGNVYLTRGELDEAERMYRNSLEIDQALGRKKGMANNYGNLGLLYKTRGDLDEAEGMYRKSLEIEEALGRKQGMASQYGNLGNVYLTRGDLDEAERMYRKSLEINEALGRKRGMASDYGNLGVLYADRGDLDEAERMYQKSLEINEALGRKQGMAKQYGNLGILYERRGDLARAREHWIKAREIFSQISMPHMVEKVQKWLDESHAKVSPANARSQGRAAEPP